MSPQYPQRTHIRWTGTEIACCDAEMRIPQSEPEHTRVDLDVEGLCTKCVAEVRYRRRTRRSTADPVL